MGDNIVYDRFIVPVALHYYGFTGFDTDYRKQSGYKTTALQQYIDKYGWDNITTTIVAEGLTRKEAEQLEDKLIKEGWEKGDCINKKGSGGKKRDNPVEYYKQHNKRYYKEHKDEIKEYVSKYIKAHKEEWNQYMKQQYSTPAGKIYNRVNGYNHSHPDCKLITPLEAKEMYELTGYIPDFIKNNDLISIL